MSDNWHQEKEQYSVKKKAYKSNPHKKEETVRDVLLLESSPWPERNLRKKTLEYFGVKTKLSTELGPDVVEKVYFPYYSQEGKICGYKVRDFTKGKDEKWHYSKVGYIGMKCQLFGQVQARKRARFLWNTEGEIDALSAFQALVDNNPKEEYKDLMPAVTSIGCGTKGAVEHLSNNLEFLKGYKDLVLCYDNDENTEIEKRKKTPGMKGKECTEAVGAFLSTNLTDSSNANIVDWPDYINDCSDALQKGKDGELFKILLNIKEYKSEKIVSLYDVFKEGELYEPMKKGVYLDSFPKLMEKWMGVRLREATLMLAPSGVGKSSVTTEMAFNYGEKEGGVGGIFLEEGMKKTGLRFVSRRLKVHPNLYKFDKEKYKTIEEHIEAERWVANPDNFLFLDHYGPIKINSLIDLARIFIYKHNRRFIVLDHISLTVTGNGDIDERVELEKAMVSLTTLCEQCDVHIMVVAHINRGGSVISGKDREFEKPKWKRTFITDGKGTQALEALAHNIIPIDVELLPDNTRGRIRLVMGKNREADMLGFCDVTKMHHKTGIFYDASNEIWTPSDGEY